MCSICHPVSPEAHSELNNSIYELLNTTSKNTGIIVEHDILDMMESAVKTLQHALSCIFYCGPYHETNKTYHYYYYYYYGKVGTSWLTFPTNLLKTLKIYSLDKCHCWKNSNFTRNLLTYFLVFTKNSWFNQELPG